VAGTITEYLLLILQRLARIGSLSVIIITPCNCKIKITVALTKARTYIQEELSFYSVFLQSLVSFLVLDVCAQQLLLGLDY